LKRIYISVELFDIAIICLGYNYFIRHRYSVTQAEVLGRILHVQTFL